MTLPNNRHNALPFLTPQTTNKDSIKGKVLGEGGVGRGEGRKDLSSESSFLPSPHLHPYPFILIITSPPGTMPLSAPSIPLMPPESICAVKGLSPTD